MNSFVTVAAWPARIFSQNAGTLFELQNAALVGMWHAEQRVLLHTGLVFEDLRVAARVAVVDQRLRRAVGPPKVTACSAARSSCRVISPWSSHLVRNIQLERSHRCAPRRRTARRSSRCSGRSTVPCEVRLRHHRGRAFPRRAPSLPQEPEEGGTLLKDQRVFNQSSKERLYREFHVFLSGHWSENQFVTPLHMACL